jgi:hypothetical protein
VECGLIWIASSFLEEQVPHKIGGRKFSAAVEERAMSVFPFGERL